MCLSLVWRSSLFSFSTLSVFALYLAYLRFDLALPMLCRGPVEAVSILCRSSVGALSRPCSCSDEALSMLIQSFQDALWPLLCRCLVDSLSVFCGLSVEALLCRGPVEAMSMLYRCSVDALSMLCRCFVLYLCIVGARLIIPLSTLCRWPLHSLAILCMALFSLSPFYPDPLVSPPCLS